MSGRSSAVAQQGSKRPRLCHFCLRYGHLVNAPLCVTVQVTGQGPSMLPAVGQHRAYDGGSRGDSILQGLTSTLV